MKIPPIAANTNQWSGRHTPKDLDLKLASEHAREFSELPAIGLYVNGHLIDIVA